MRNQKSNSYQVGFAKQNKEHNKTAPPMRDVTKGLTYPPIQPVNLKIETTAILNWK